VDEVADFVKMTSDRPIDYRFIEFMPFSMNDWDEKRMVPYREAIQEIVKSYPDFEPCVTDPNSTSKVNTTRTPPPFDSVLRPLDHQWRFARRCTECRGSWAASVSYRR